MKMKALLLTMGLFTVCLLNNNFLFAQPTAGMVGHFKFDGNLTNFGSGTMSATSSNTTYSTNNVGAPNKALMFGGTTTSYASITDNGNLDFTGDFSIAFGVYTPSIAVNHGYYDNGLNYGGCGIWFFASDNTLRFNFRNASIGAPAAIPANQWRAVCAVRSGSTIKLYVSGILVASGTEGTMALSYPYPPVLGQMFYQGTGGNYNPSPNGAKLDEMRFYNRALSAAEIATLVAYTLPLKLGDFTAVKRSSGIQLDWETLTEQNTSHFEIERSINATDYVAIGKVNAKGNSNITQHYTYTDNKPFAGTNYYRLKMVDIDQAFTYSPVVAIKNNDQPLSLELFPNPVHEMLQVQLSSKQKETVSLSISSQEGKIVFSRSITLNDGNNAIGIPLLHLPNGTYYFTLANTEGKQSKVFIKQ